MSRSTFEQNLRDRRRQLGLTQQDLAYALGVGSVTISRWERGASAPRWNMLFRIAQQLECTVEDLLRDTTKNAA